MDKKTKRIIALVIAVLIGFISFLGLSKPATNPETYKNTIQTIDETQDTVTGLTAAGIGVSTVLAAIPGEATTPMANKVMDVTGYLFAVLCVVTLEKYMLTLTGALVFKIMVPLACALACAYIFTHMDVFRALAARFLIFGILLYALVPTSVYVSSLIADTYEDSKEYSVERMEEEFSKIEKNTEDKDQSFWKKFKDTVSTTGNHIISKAENSINNFIEYVAVLMVINIGIPILTVFLFLWLAKLFFGLSGPVQISGLNTPSRIATLARKNRD